MVAAGNRAESKPKVAPCRCQIAEIFHSEFRNPSKTRSHPPLCTNLLHLPSHTHSARILS